MANQIKTIVAGLALLAASFSARPSAAAEQPWSLTTADLSTEPVTLTSIDPAGLKVAPVAAAGGAAKAVPMDQFVELSRPAPTAKREGKFDLLLVGGERVNGEPVGIKGESLVWKNPVVGDVPVPLRLVSTLVKADGPASMDARREDELKLTNGDVVRGAVTELSPQQVVVKTDVGDTPVPFTSVVSVAFATAAAAPGTKDKPSFRVRLDEGSSIAASAVKAGDGRLEATLGGAATGSTKSIDLSRVTLIEQVNGPVAFLSTRTPKENVYTPYLGGDQRFLARFNADFEGNPVRFRDRVFPRSVAAHSYSRISWPVEGGYVAFRTRYAMDAKAAQGGGGGGDVTVRIKLDGKVVHEQANVRPGVLSPPVTFDLSSAKTLTLEVDYGLMVDSNDRLNWLDPALLRVRPAGGEPATKPADAPAKAQ